jgi:hypothetical protein
MMVLDVRFFNKNITLSKNKMNIFVIKTLVMFVIWLLQLHCDPLKFSSKITNQ